MERALLSVPAGPELPGWHLVVLLKDPKVFEVASQRRVAAYLWIGSLAVVVVSILSIFAMRVIRRQAALTRLKNDLVATVSHELKTPLASMRVLVDTLLDSRQLSEQTTREYLGLIASENERLSRMIENFLTFSRLERQRYNFHFAPWPAAAIVDSVVEICQPRLAVPGCQFEVQVEAGLPNVNADCDAMATALSNLLDNACKYSQEIKHIILRVRAAEGAILFEVEDNGIGIPSREVKRIFRDFYQVDQRLCRDGSGCGLGLSIVQSIVTAHGGSVRVSSEPGRGSKFSISIPVAAVTTETGRKAVA
jgi:signal transduction histidine kinase